MCGIVGAYALNNGSQNVYPLVVRALLDLQHRGQLSAGITSYNPERKRILQTYKDNGKVHEVFQINHPYKNYSNKTRLKRRDIVSISTIEIIASRQYIIDSQVRFNASMGLGTKFPSCEENIFLLDLFDLGAEIQHIPEYVQNHPYINRTFSFLNPDILFAKGVFCKRYNGVMGVLLLLFWLIRASWNGAGFRDSFQLVSGYLYGNKILIY